MDANNIQKRMQDLQKNEDFASAFSKMVSGKPGYKAVIEKKTVIIQCRGCGMILEDQQKFCPECGTKTVFPPKQ